jgi:ATP synthase protein I
VAERPDDEPPARSRGLGDEVGPREERKLRARRAKDRTVWSGLGMFGVVGWSVATPTLIGIGLGVWLDRTNPGRFSWTLALLLAGVTLGCMNAWYWVSGEQKLIDEDEKGTQK